MGWIKRSDSGGLCGDCPATPIPCYCLDCYDTGYSGTDRLHCTGYFDVWLRYKWPGYSGDCQWYSVPWAMYDPPIGFTSLNFGSGTATLMRISSWVKYGGEWYPISDFEAHRYASGSPLALEACGEYVDGSKTVTISFETPPP